MAVFRIRGVQMRVSQSKKENLPRILEEIKKSRCDVVVFPEMSLTGYNNDFGDARTQEAWRQIAAACRTQYVTAVIGTGCREDGETYIQARIYGPLGQLVGTHEKLIPTAGDRSWCVPGTELRTFSHDGLTYGVLLGNDLWVAPTLGAFPDPRLSYQLAQRGAQVIFHLAHTGTDPKFESFYESNLRLRAQESGAYIITVNAAALDQPINAPSGIVAPDGRWLVQCPRIGEHVFEYDLNLETE